MPRPQTKEDLIIAATTNYEKLLEMIDSMTDIEKNTPFDFSDQPSKKEAHWKRDKNVRDVLSHLTQWHNLTLEWVKNNEKGIHKPFLIEGYNWKSYGDMNVMFWKNCQNISMEDALKQFKDSHKKIMKLIDSLSNEEIFAKDSFDWTGTSCLGSYFVSNTSSHYDWAMKKIKAHKKNCKDME